MSIYYEFWGKEAEDKEQILLYKWPAEQFKTDEGREVYFDTIKELAGRQGITSIEIRKVEQKGA
jgi:hypothetical protein